MLLTDSRASFEIEGELPPRNRLERWGRAVLQAAAAELERVVQRIAERIGRSLERSSLTTRDIENAYPAFDPARQRSATSNYLLL
jgi:hypothetical protein